MASCGMRLRLSIVGTFTTAIVRVLYSHFSSQQNKWDSGSWRPIHHSLFIKVSRTCSPPSLAWRDGPSLRPDGYQSACPALYKQFRDTPDLSGIDLRQLHRKSPSR